MTLLVVEQDCRERRRPVQRPLVQECLSAVEIDRNYHIVPQAELRWTGAGYVFREDGSIGPRSSLGCRSALAGWRISRAW
jgi:hypothetical protein